MGAPKTGTSYVQKTLGDLNHELIEKKIYYPKNLTDTTMNAGNGSGLLNVLNKDKDAKTHVMQYLRDLASAADSLICNRIIISSERLSYLNDTQVASLFECIDTLSSEGILSKAIVVFASRGRESFSYSLYKQALKANGYSGGYEKFISDYKSSINQVMEFGGVLMHQSSQHSSIELSMLQHGVLTGESIVRILTNSKISARQNLGQINRSVSDKYLIDLMSFLNMSCPGLGKIIEELQIDMQSESLLDSDTHAISSMPESICIKGGQQINKESLEYKCSVLIAIIEHLAKYIKSGKDVYYHEAAAHIYEQEMESRRVGKEFADLPGDFFGPVYSLLNIDVMMAGIDPSLHYLKNGKQEERRYRPFD